MKKQQANTNTPPEKKAMQTPRKRTKKIKVKVERTPQEIARHNILVQKIKKAVKSKLNFIEFLSNDQKSTLLSQLTLLQIKGLNKDAGKSTTGSKQELIDRLLQFGAATSPYKNSAVRASPRKPGTPKIPDCYPDHMVTILLRVIGVNDAHIKRINPCFKAILSRRLLTLVRHEDFIQQLFTIRCAGDFCTHNIQFTKLDLLAQNFGVFKKCEKCNHENFISGICCSNPINQKANKNCMKIHVDQHWLYGYCTRNKSNRQPLLCNTCNVPQTICNGFISLACVDNCQELIDVKNVTVPVVRFRKKKIKNGDNNTNTMKSGNTSSSSNVKKSIDKNATSSSHVKFLINEFESTDSSKAATISSNSTREMILTVKKRGNFKKGTHLDDDNEDDDAAMNNLLGLRTHIKSPIRETQDMATNTSFTLQLSKESSNESDTNIMLFEEPNIEERRRVGKKSKSPNKNANSRAMKKSNLIVKSSYVSSPVSGQSSDGNEENSRDDYEFDQRNDGNNNNFFTPQFSKPSRNSMMIYGGNNKFKGLDQSSSSSNNSSSMNNSGSNIENDSNKKIIVVQNFNALTSNQESFEKEYIKSGSCGDSNDSKSEKASSFVTDSYREFQNAFSPVAMNTSEIDFVFDIGTTGSIGVETENDISDLSISDLPTNLNISQFELNDSEDFLNLNISGGDNDDSFTQNIS